MTPPKSIEGWLRQATSMLTAADIATARLDALVLLTDCLERDKAWVLAHSETALSGGQLEQLDQWLERRIRHEPLSYIRQKTEFYGRNFIVSPAVLEPRPESEALLEQLLADAKLYDQNDLIVIDVGTGSGALAVSAALALPNARVIGLDNDPTCLAVARQNAQLHDAKIEWLESDLLANVPMAVWKCSVVLLCNLPYVPSEHAINTAATFEPPQAIFGGKDGLDLYRRLFDQLNTDSRRPDLLLFESLTSQHQALEALAKANNYGMRQENGLMQSFAPL